MIDNILPKDQAEFPILTICNTMILVQKGIFSLIFEAQFFKYLLLIQSKGRYKNARQLTLSHLLLCIRKVSLELFTVYFKDNRNILVQYKHHVQ